MVDGERALEPVGSHMSGVPVAAHVVDERIQARKVVQDLCRQPSHLRLFGHIGNEQVDLPADGGLYLTSRVLGAVRISTGDGNVSAQLGKAQGRCPADATGGPGDEHRLAGQRPAVALTKARGYLWLGVRSSGGSS